MAILLYSTNFAQWPIVFVLKFYIANFSDLSKNRTEIRDRGRDCSTRIEEIKFEEKNSRETQSKKGVGTNCITDWFCTEPMTRSNPVPTCYLFL